MGAEAGLPVGGEGTALWFLGTLTFVKATSEMTRGAFGLIEQVIPVGFASPYHVHRAEDESFYVIEGQVSFVCDGWRLKVGPGAYVFGPRDIPHGFRVEGTDPARLLILATPGGFERFVVEMSEPASTAAIPPPGEINMQKLMRLAQQYRIEILGPLPDKWKRLGPQTGVRSVATATVPSMAHRPKATGSQQ